MSTRLQILLIVWIQELSEAGIVYTLVPNAPNDAKLDVTKSLILNLSLYSSEVSWQSDYLIMVARAVGGE